MTRNVANGWIAYTAFAVAIIAAISILTMTNDMPRWAATLPPFIGAALITIIMYGSAARDRYEEKVVDYQIALEACRAYKQCHVHLRQLGLHQQADEMKHQEEIWRRKYIRLANQ